MATDSTFAEFDDSLREGLAALGLSLADAQRKALHEHYAHMLEANKQFNLTRITSPADAAVKHVVDSLALLTQPWIDSSARWNVLDVGTGAGYPALPLAVACPRWGVTAIDGTGKKARFVAETAAALGLKNLHGQHARAADLARESDSQFDLITLRAVTQIASGLKETHALLRRNGCVTFYKTAGISAEETNEGHKVARTLKLREVAGPPVRIPAPDGPLERQFITFRG